MSLSARGPAGPHQSVRYDPCTYWSTCDDCGASAPEGGEWTPYCGGRGWLDHRINEVVKPTPRSRDTGDHVVVDMKLRMGLAVWSRFKDRQLHEWGRSGVQLRFVSRYERDHPTWYDRHHVGIT